MNEQRTVDTLPGIKLDGHGQILRLNPDNRPLLIVVLVHEGEFGGTILQRRQRSSMVIPKMGGGQRTKVFSKNAFESPFHSAMTSSLSPSSASLRRSQTRLKSSSLTTPSPMCSHMAFWLRARAVLNAGQ